MNEILASFQLLLHVCHDLTLAMLSQQAAAWVAPSRNWMKADGVTGAFYPASQESPSYLLLELCLQIFVFTSLKATTIQ